MTSDISRQTFDSRKHYSKVVMQQGRVQLDADWNEQQDILQHRIETQTSDMIGVSGASTSSNGFAVTFTPDHTDLIVSPGHMYVHGVLCELEEEEAIPVQSVVKGRIKIDLADVDNPPLKQDKPGTLPDADEQAYCPFKKDHWVELIDKNGQPPSFIKVTNVEVDREKQAVFLSTGRSDLNQGRDVFKVRPVMTYLTQPDYPQPDQLIANLLTPEKTSNKYVVFLAYLDVWQRQITALDDPDIREVALGGADTAQRMQTLWQVKIMPIELTVRDNLTEARDLIETIKKDTGNLKPGDKLEREMSRLLRILTFMPPISQWKAPIPSYAEKPNPGRLSVRLASDAGTYQGLENQLYRVEIDQEVSKDNPIPTFKWARNNASSIVEANVNEGAVTIPGGGQGSLLGLKVGQYVELVDEQSELLGESRALAQITVVNDITGELTLNRSLPGDLSKKFKLRLWDGSGNIDGSKGTNKSKDGWLVLENGIEIQFTLDTKENTYSYKSGDYWLLPARTATGQIDWPHTTSQPPLGIEHHYARLACLLHTKSLPLVQDCRRHFFPLAAIALHILDINWKNDTLIPNERHLLSVTEGLRITLDGEPDSEYVRAMQAAMIVSIETALPGGGAGYFLVSGIFNIDGNVITWHWGKEERLGLIAEYFSKFDEFLSRLFDKHEHHLRVRVTLKGHLIWQTVNGRRIYLDGQAFGIPGETEKSGYKLLPEETEEHRGRHIDLQFPSGTGRPASDFESWFYLKE